MADTDDDGFITLPPGIFDASTFKLPPKPERPAPRPEIVFVPTTPGMPPVAPPEPAAPDLAPETAIPAAPAAAPAPPAPPAPTASFATAPPIAEVSQETRREPLEWLGAAAAPSAPPAPAWTLVLADGTAAPVRGTLLLGRNPAAFDAWPGAELLAVADTTQSVSKTHAAFEADGSGLWVHDLDSTNGVWVVDGANVTEAVPGRRVRVPAGASVELGDYVLTVRG